MNKWLLILVMGIVSTNLCATPCFLTMMKDNCWANYSLSVTAVDTKTNQIIATIVVPKGQSWARQPFNCSPGQVLEFQATFSPTIWQGQENKVYSSEEYRRLPAALEKGQAAWNINLCFAADFSGLPTPPTATNNCACDASKIPAIPLQ